MPPSQETAPPPGFEPAYQEPPAAAELRTIAAG